MQTGDPEERRPTASRRERRSGAWATLVLLLVAGLAVAAASGVQAGSRPGYVLGVSNMLVGNGWRESMICAIKAQARASRKVARVIVANRNGGPAEQRSDIRLLVAAGVDAIVVYPSSPSALDDVIAEARAAGVRVVAVDQPVTAAGVTSVVNDQVAYGRLGAEWLFRRLGGQGRVVEMRGIRGVQVDSERHEGFVQARRRYPGIKVVRQTYTGWVYGAAGEQMAALLRSGVEIDGVWTSGIDYTVVNAFRAAGAPLVPIVGTDTNEFLRQLRTVRGLRGAVVTNSATIGGVAAAVAIRLLDGRRVPRRVVLTPQVWDNRTPAGRAAIRLNYAPTRPVTASARIHIRPWTTYTRQQLFACRNVG